MKRTMIRFFAILRDALLPKPMGGAIQSNDLENTL